eukprot:6902112-Pyramimonas_sp.AAC.1
MSKRIHVNTPPEWGELYMVYMDYISPSPSDPSLRVNCTHPPTWRSCSVYFRVSLPLLYNCATHDKDRMWPHHHVATTYPHMPGGQHPTKP